MFFKIPLNGVVEPQRLTATCVSIPLVADVGMFALN